MTRTNRVIIHFRKTKIKSLFFYPTINVHKCSINVRTRTMDVQIHLKAVENRSAIPGQGTMWRKLCFITNSTEEPRVSPSFRVRSPVCSTMYLTCGTKILRYENFTSYTIAYNRYLLLITGTIFNFHQHFYNNRGNRADQLSTFLNQKLHQDTTC